MNRVLIANRGEIAVRVNRACRELEWVPIAIYGPGEEDAVHVRAADDAYLLPESRGLPYLDIKAIVAIASRADANLVHPGYGFLSENADFVRAVEEQGIQFVGPCADAVHALGDKVRAREIAAKANVPIVPGSRTPIESIGEATTLAKSIGYPIAVKAAAGGGGRGFRVARFEAELEDALQGASGEAERYFGDETVYLERYLERPRHVEIQLAADTFGNTVWLGERDCSVQRRHQKLIEETPSPAVDESLRTQLGEAAVRLARAVEYVNAGTVEFLVDESGAFYFLEMNARIQVEHTITEEVTGIDLVKEQLRIATGNELSFRQEDVQSRGHAIQCRINAEDAGSDFRPVSGRIEQFATADGPGIRIDTAMEAGAEISPQYDSMIAKLVAWGRNRDESIERIRRALDEMVVKGVPTTIPFHQNVMNHPVFRAGDVTTSFLVDYGNDVVPKQSDVIPSHSAGSPGPRLVLVEVDGRRLQVRLHDSPGNADTNIADNPRPRLKDRTSDRSNNGGAGNEIRSPLQGTVVRLSVSEGDEIDENDLLCVIEAMKMENEITAHRSGTVIQLDVSAGDTVVEGSLIATLD